MQSYKTDSGMQYDSAWYAVLCILQYDSAWYVVLCIQYNSAWYAVLCIQYDSAWYAVLCILQYDSAWYAVLCIQLRHASRVDKVDAWGRGGQLLPLPHYITLLGPCCYLFNLQHGFGHWLSSTINRLMYLGVPMKIVAAK